MLFNNFYKDFAGSRKVPTVEALICNRWCEKPKL